MAESSLTVRDPRFIGVVGSTVEFETIARWIERVIRNHADISAIASVRNEVTDLCRKFPIYGQL